MAERRMFAKTIIDSDAFLDLPSSTQSLYFHLGMRADDDGFINNPKKIQRVIGGSDDDLKLLIAKKFIIPFESGVVVIKHWKIHNYIQSDRYKPTMYREEKEKLVTKDNKSYKLLKNVDESMMYPECIQDGDTGKVRLGKVSLGKVREEEKPDPTPYQEIVDLFNEICTKSPKILKTTDKRKKQIALRYKELGDINIFEQAFRMVQESKFLTGDNDRGWVVKFDWLMANDTNIVKVLEGNYKNNKTKSSNPFKDVLREMMENDETGDCLLDDNNKNSLPKLLP